MDQGRGLSHEEFLRIEQLLLRAARRMTRSREEARDLVQETLAAFLPSREPRQPAELVSAALGTMLLVRARRSRLAATEVTLDNATELPDPSNLESDLILSEVVRGAFRALTRTERRLLYLKFVSNYTASALSEELGMAPSEVRATLREALAKIRGAFDADAGAPAQPEFAYLSASEIDDLIESIATTESRNRSALDGAVIIQGSYMTPELVNSFTREWTDNLAALRDQYQADVLFSTYLRAWNYNSKNEIHGRLLGGILSSGRMVMAFDSEARLNAGSDFDSDPTATIIHQEVAVHLSEPGKGALELAEIDDNTPAAAMWRAIRELLCENTKRFAKDKAGLKKLLDHSVTGTATAIALKFGVQFGVAFYGVRSLLGLALKVGVASVCDSNLLPAPKKPDSGKTAKHSAAKKKKKPPNKPRS